MRSQELAVHAAWEGMMTQGAVSDTSEGTPALAGAGGTSGTLTLGASVLSILYIFLIYYS